MATHLPAYRATVYAPKSTDATEATVLTPQVPSPSHTDAFRVASIDGHSGGGFTWRPYLEIVKPRHTKVDVFSRNFDEGQITLRLLDKRTGTSNLERWVTAFTGDSKGAGLLVGRKVKVEESLDGGSTWADYFTGRISTGARDDGRLWWNLHVEDMTAALKDKLFTHPPHPSATTAQAPQMLPLGLEKTYAGLAVSPPLTGSIQTHKAGFGPNGETVAPVDLSGAGEKLWRMVLAGTEPIWLSGQYYVYLTWNSGANSGRFLGCPLPSSIQRLHTYGAHQQLFVFQLGIIAQDASAPGYSALPAAGTAVTVRVQPRQWKVTDRMPILIDDVHPVTLARWVIDGYFGDLNTDGTPKRAVTRYNATGAAGDPFYDLEQDATFGTVREKITEPMPRRDFLIKKILQPRGLALAVDESGKVRITDVRARATLGSLPAITNADCIADRPAKWRHRKEGAVSRMDTIIYLDRQRPITDTDYEPSSPPDYAPSLIESEEIPRYDLNIGERAMDADGKPVTIDGTGFRALVDEWSAPDAAAAVRSARELRIRRDVARVEDEYRRLFGSGPITAELTLRRNATTNDVRPGRYFLATVDELVDPATGRLGAQRLLLCTSRSEDGLALTVEALDFGKNTVAANPSIAIAASVTDPSHTIDVTATLSADLDPMLIEYAATLTSVGSRPGDTDARWTRAYLAEATGARSVGHLPSGRRIWFRAGAMPFAWKGFKRPSAFVYPGGTGYIDLTAISGPTAGATSSITKNTFRGTWTNGNTADVVDVFLIQSASAPADWTEAYRVATLPAGSTQYDFSGLTAAAGSSYTWHARCRDAQGGVSAGTGTTITSGATAGTAPTPPSLIPSPRGLSTYGGKDARLSDTVGTRAFRIGVELSVVAADPAYDVEIERAPDSAGSPGTWAQIAVQPGYQDLFFDALPANGATYWYRHRQSGLGATASGYSDPVSATPQRHYGDVRAIEAARRAVTALDTSGRLSDLRRLGLAGTAGVHGFQSANPITYSSSSSTDATISIAAHTLDVPSGASTGVAISYNSGSIVVGSLERDTWFYVFTDDPNYAGGAVTYLKTQFPGVLANRASRYYVGKVRVPSGHPVSGTGVGGSDPKISG